MPEMTQDDLSLTVERRINAPVEKVYAAWLDPATLTRFFSNVPGVTLSAAKAEPRVGGRFQLDIQAGGKTLPHSGTYLELNPHSRIAFTWESHSSTVEGSTVTLDLVPDRTATLLTLTHVRFANEARRNDHAGSWAKILDALTTTNL